MNVGASPTADARSTKPKETVMNPYQWAYARHREIEAELLDCDADRAELLCAEREQVYREFYNEHLEITAEIEAERRMDMAFSGFYYDPYEADLEARYYRCS